MLNARITGVGKYLPPTILTNQDLEKMVDTTNKRIVEMTGIKERRLAWFETPSDMGAKAAKEALEDNGLKASALDHIIVATVRGDYHFPSCACQIQDKIGAINASAVDINSGCTGFIQGLEMAAAYIRSGIYKKILLVGAEKLSDITDYTDRSTCILFGDGAGAVVLEATEEKGRGIIATKLFSDGKKGSLLFCQKMPNGEELLRMYGNRIYEPAIRGMVQASETVLKMARLKKDDIKLVIPHQANKRIILMVAEKMEIPIKNIFINIEKYGNMSSATIPIALREAYEKDRISPNDVLLFTAFGAGLTWGAAIVRW
ncbi:MAG: ketoacyl-ACP synthase III [Candidatus Moranbacteria bacterium]|nr:ketoacyl-ACP synthase III [Candidatus Moranbacteria bacterium]